MRDAFDAEAEVAKLADTTASGDGITTPTRDKPDVMALVAMKRPSALRKRPSALLKHPSAMNASDAKKIKSNSLTPKNKHDVKASASKAIIPTDDEMKVGYWVAIPADAKTGMRDPLQYYTKYLRGSMGCDEAKANWANLPKNVRDVVKARLQELNVVAAASSAE
jgi:hypothetical protein